jgi:rhodanese-related sulfurtransferase
MANSLSRVGLFSLLIFSLLLPGGLLAGDTPERITVDQVEVLLDKGEKVVFLDSRNSYAWDNSPIMLPGAIRVHDNASLAAVVDTLPREGKIVTYCT